MAVLGLLLFWGYERLVAKRGPAAAAAPSIPAWTLAVAAVLGSAVFALAAEHRLDSRVFLATLRDGGELFWPFSHSAHPLYPLRVALTFLEGWLVFVLLVDVCRRAPDPRRRAHALLSGWLAGFALVSGFAVVQYVTRFQLHPYWVRANPNIVRAHSTLEDPNALGAYLVLGIGLLAGLLLLDDGRRRRVWLALLALGTAGLLTTMSRAAIGAAVLAPMLVLAFVPRPATRAQRMARLAGRIAIASLLVVLTGSAIARLFISERTRTQPTNEVQLVVKTFDPRESPDWVLRGRLEWWEASFRMFREHPWTGVGLGRVPRLMGAYGGGRFRENTHNLYLQMFAETGILGGLAFVGLAAGLCVALARTLRDATLGRSRGLALGGLVGVVGFLVTLLTGHTLLLASGQILCAALVAPILCLGTWEPATSHSAVAARPRRPIRALPAVCLAVAAWYPVAAAVRDVSPPVGPWGYAWGLHGQEHAGGGVTYRWTKARALMDVDVPAGTSLLELPVAAPTPIRDGKPVRVRISVAGRTEELTLRTPDVQTVPVALAGALPSGGGRLTIEVQVDPTFIPSQGNSQSSDRRLLGVQLLRPRFLTSGNDTHQ